LYGQNITQPDFNTYFTKRRENPMMDKVAGVVFLYTAFMFSCGRFNMSQRVRVHFLTPNTDLQAMFAMLGSGFLETNDTSNANIIIAKERVNTSYPVSALVITFGGSGPKLTMGPVGITTLFCYPI
jgi:hypothetical protein